MRDDDAPPEPPYDGPYCVLRRDDALYTVAIEPLMPCGDGQTQSYATKIGAWGQMLLWVQAYGLPVLNLLDPKVADPREK